MMMKTQLMDSAEFGVANKDHLVGNIYGKKGDAKKYDHTLWKKKVSDDIAIDGVELTEPWIELLAVEQDETWRKSVNLESSSSSMSQSARSPTNVVINAPNHCTNQSDSGMSGPQCSRVSPLARTEDYDSAKSGKSVFSKFGHGMAKLLKSKKGRMDIDTACDSIYSTHVQYSHNTGESTVNISLDVLLIIETILYAGKVIGKQPSAKREAPGYCGCNPSLL